MRAASLIRPRLLLNLRSNQPESCRPEARLRPTITSAGSSTNNCHSPAPSKRSMDTRQSVHKQGRDSNTVAPAIWRAVHVAARRLRGPREAGLLTWRHLRKPRWLHWVFVAPAESRIRPLSAYIWFSQCLRSRILAQPAPGLAQCHPAPACPRLVRAAGEQPAR